MPLAVRGTSSIDTTVLFGLELEAVALPLAEAPCAPPLAVSDIVPVELPELAVPVPELPDWSEPLLPEVPELPEVPDVPDVPEVPELVPVPVPVPVPVVPPASLPLVVPDELPLPLAPLLPVPLPVSLPPRMDAQPDRPSAMASKPASTTL